LKYENYDTYKLTDKLIQKLRLMTTCFPVDNAAKLLKNKSLWISTQLFIQQSLVAHSVESALVATRRQNGGVSLHRWIGWLLTLTCGPT